MSDSEFDIVEEKQLLQGKKATVRKGKSSTAVREKRSRTPLSDNIEKKKMKSYDIFGLSHGGVENEENEKKTLSYFVNKVANGNERRTASLLGSYVLDLKLYHVNDVQNTESKDVWRKALVRIKVQTQDDTEQWKLLQKLVTSIDKNFVDKPQFYSDKVSLK